MSELPPQGPPGEPQHGSNAGSPDGGGAPSPPAPPVRPPLPFEDTGRSFLEGLLQTVMLLVTNPKEAFARMTPESMLGRALFYGVLLAWFGTFCGLVWNMLFGEAFSSFMPAEYQDQWGMMGTTGFGQFVIMMVISPVLTLIWLFVLGAVVHVFLMMFGGANKGFSTTIKVVAYAETAQLAAVVPIVGGLAAFFWWIALSIVGLAEAHGTSLGKAAGAVLAPVLLCCVCLIVGVVLFAGSILALATGQ